MASAGEGTFPVQHTIRGRVLQTASWAARVVGAVMAVAGTWDMLTDVFNVLQTSPPSDKAFARFVSLYLPFPFSLLAAVLLASVGRQVYAGGLALRRRARLDLARVVKSASDLLPGGYVLYLRPFGWDGRGSAIGPAAASQIVWAAIVRSSRTYEERLERMFKGFGPMIAVGRPGESLPGGSGAYRSYIGHDWHGTVSGLIDRAGLVVLGAGPNAGTVWEYREVVRRCDPYRLVVMVTDPNSYEEFRALANAAVADMAESVRRQYGRLWRPPVLPRIEVPVDSSTRRTFFLKAVVVFDADWTPRPRRFSMPYPPDISDARRWFRDDFDLFLVKAMRPVLAHVARGPHDAAQDGWTAVPDVELPVSTATPRPASAMKRQAWRELHDAFVQSLPQPADALRSETGERRRAAEIVDALRAEAELPDWAEMRQIAGDAVPEESHRRAFAALHDSGACPSCGRTEICKAPRAWSSAMKTDPLLADFLRPAPRDGKSYAPAAVTGGCFAVVGVVLAVLLALGRTHVHVLSWGARLSFVTLFMVVIGVVRLQSGQPRPHARRDPWRAAWYCADCRRTFYDFGEAPDEVGERELMSLEEFQKLAWKHHGFDTSP